MKTPALALAALLWIPAAPAQHGWPRDLQPQLRQAETSLRGRGFHQRGGLVAGSLEQGDYRDLDVNLGSGQYEVLVVCGANCGDVDLARLGRRSRTASHDGVDGDTATLQIEQTEPGRLRVRVTMDVCMADVCRFALAVFGRSTSL